MKQVVTKLWIDESGDCGFKFGRGSSRFLIIVAVYLIGESNIEKVINRLKAKLRLTKHHEFKFSRCKDRFREEFLRVLQRLSIQYKAIVVDKKKIQETALRQAQQLYCEAIRRLLYDNNPSLEKAILIIDEATAKIHHKEFNRVLKKYLSKNIINKIRQKRSKGEIMIQIADMIAGSIFRKYEKGDDQYYQIVQNKEKILIEF